VPLGLKLTGALASGVNFFEKIHDHSVEQMCLRKAACGYLNKPFERAELLLMVRRVLDANRFKPQPGSDKSTL